MSREKRVHYGPRQAVWSAVAASWSTVRASTTSGNRETAHLDAVRYSWSAVLRTELCPVPECWHGKVSRLGRGMRTRISPCPSHRDEEYHEQVDLDLARAALGPDGRVAALLYERERVFALLWPLSPPTREEVEQAIASIEARPPGADDAAYRAHLDRFAGVVSQLRSLVDRGVSPAASSCDTLGPAMNTSSAPTREEVEQPIVFLAGDVGPWLPDANAAAACRAHLDRFASWLRSRVDRGVSPPASSCDTLGPAMNPSSTS